MKKFDLLTSWQKGEIDRRTFLTGLAAISTIIVLPACNPDSEPDTRDPDVLSGKEWDILKASQNHMFPKTEDAPGADEINATVYLQAVLSDKNGDPEEQDFIKSGITWVEEEAKETEGRSFLSLDEDGRERVLRSMETHGWGERWLSLILLYIFEALLSDPLYGGNPDGVGWAWLEHYPGVPRPTKDKIYGRL
ncbi:MAG: gluconate 2-dehydrogenase subunit 3 family protein [Bacteroidales bacterium]|nr:gluconate 2-dehydrogenase subunit 3 family protein [Bacteroidales bacterium]